MNQNNMQKLFKNLDFKPSGLGDEGTFYGYASVFNIEDSHSDIILPGAFRDTLDRKIKLLWQHDPTLPIGNVLGLKEDTKGLYIEAKLNLKTSLGKEAYELLKEGNVDGLSIGFVVQDYYYDKFGRRCIASLDLYEISVVTFPSNEESKVIEVKELDLSFKKLSLCLDDALKLMSLE